MKKLLVVALTAIPLFSCSDPGWLLTGTVTDMAWIMAADDDREIMKELCATKAEVVKSRAKEGEEIVGEVVNNKCIIGPPEVVAEVKKSMIPKQPAPESDSSANVFGK